MDKYVPRMYKESIHAVNYDKLKEMNIKCIIFDLDNTLLEVNSSIPEEKTQKLIEKLKKDFKIYIISNNSHSDRLMTAANSLDVNYVKFAMKPFGKAFRKVLKENNYKKEDMCIIGDQIMTDVLGGNRFGIFTILVEPLSEQELKVTGINRFFERRQLKRLLKQNKFKKGEYYE